MINSIQKMHLAKDLAITVHIRHLMLHRVSRRNLYGVCYVCYCACTCVCMYVCMYCPGHISWQENHLKKLRKGH